MVGKLPKSKRTDQVEFAVPAKQHGTPGANKLQQVSWVGSARRSAFTLFKDWMHRLRIANRTRLMRRRAKQGRVGAPLVVMPVAHLELPVLKDAQIDPANIRLATSEAPDVSILIPAYGKADMTLRCLASLHLAAPALAYEVIVAEDASGEPDAERVGLVPGVRFVAHPQNLGFLRSCNTAARLARGRYLLFLNNDTQILPGAIEALRKTFDTHSGAGLVGSRLVYPDGRLQEAGGIVWNDGSARNHGRFGDRLAPEYSYLRETDYISGASIMVDAALWRQLGGFDERFCPAYYEDTDLAMQVRQAGRQVIYQPASTVVHLEGVTSGTDTGSGVKRYQDINARKFADKWHEVLQRDHYPNAPENIFAACDRAHRGPIVLVTNDLVVQPDVDAGSRAIAQSMDALLAMGCAVKFWPENPFEFSQYAEHLRQRGIEVIAGKRRPSFKAWIQAYGSQITHAFLHRPEQTAVFLPLVRQYAPHACIAYYGHDLHYRRMQAQAAVHHDTRMKISADRLHAIEARIWKSADVSVYFSQEEVDIVRAQCPKADVRTVQAYCFDEVIVPRSPVASRRVIFVAGFGHPPNIDAALWLVQEVMPQVWAQEPDVQLSLVGSKPTDQVKALASPQVEVTGWVSDEQLAEIYARSRVAVVPLRFGAGVKHKVVEALAHGLPLVTTPVGAQGLPGLEHACAIADKADALAHLIVRLLRDDEAWMTTVQEAAAYIHQHFSRDSMQHELDGLLQAMAQAGSPSQRLAHQDT